MMMSYLLEIFPEIWLEDNKLAMLTSEAIPSTHT